MSDRIFTGRVDDHQERLVDMGDGTFAQVRAVGGVVSPGNNFQGLLRSGEWAGPWEINNFEQAGAQVKSASGGTLYLETGILLDTWREDEHGPGFPDSQIQMISSEESRVFPGELMFRSIVKMPGVACRLRFVSDQSANDTTIRMAYGSNMVPASVSDDNELLTTVTESERDVYTALGLSDLSTGNNSVKWGLLIDLSDRIGFKHQRSGRVDLTRVNLTMIPAARSSGQLQVGVVTAIDASSMTVQFVVGMGFYRALLTDTRDRGFSPSQLKCGVVNGELTKVVSSAKVTTFDITADTELESPIGMRRAEVGDIVVRATRTLGRFDTFVSAFYHGERLP